MDEIAIICDADLAKKNRFIRFARARWTLGEILEMMEYCKEAGE